MDLKLLKLKFKLDEVIMFDELSMIVLCDVEWVFLNKWWMNELLFLDLTDLFCVLMSKIPSILEKIKKTKWRKQQSNDHKRFTEEENQ